MGHDSKGYMRTADHPIEAVRVVNLDGVEASSEAHLLPLP